MRFAVTQTFRSPAEAVTAAYADPALYPSLVGLPKLGGVEALTHERDGDHVLQRIRYRFTGHLPSAVTAVVDPAKLSWVQESDHDLATGTTTFRLLPDHYPDRLRASGTFEVRPAGRVAGASRVVTGELKVRAPLVAGRVEGAIVSGLEEYLAAEAPRVDAWIDGGS